MKKGHWVRVRYYWCILFCLSIAGCADVNIKRISPASYAHASDFANESIKETTCMGHIDSLYAEPGHISTDNHGILTFIGNHVETHCNVEDFRNALENYCQAKGGKYRAEWCVKDDEPIFNVQGFTIEEKSDHLSEAQWQKIARIQLGYTSLKEITAQQESNDAQAALLEEQRKKRLSSSVQASIGDFICREDLLTNHQDYLGPVYYGAYVEGRHNGKLKLRVVWHGRKNTDITNEYSGNVIIWEYPQGWFACDQQIINNLP